MRVLLVTCGVVTFAAAGIWYSGLLHPGEPMPEVTAVSAAGGLARSARVNVAAANPIDEALQLIYAARDRFLDVRDYRCTFLRDEFIDGELQLNHIKLAVRHEPFSVYMEWLGPRSKRGRQTIYVDGQNNGKMLVKQLITLRLDPQESIRRKESRHVITEAGLKNSIERFVKGWEREKALNKVEVAIHDGDLKINLGERDVVRPYRCVSTKHDPKDRELFTFFRAHVFFDKETGLPMRIEGYDWPKNDDDKDGQLVERYTYLDLEKNVGLTDKHFSF